jgi:hypothetical protein
MAETLAPDQGGELLQVADLASNNRDNRALDQSSNNKMIQNIKQLYHLYVEQKMPFDEQARLLSLLRRSWLYEKIIDIFGCSRHAIKTAHKMHDEQEYFLKRDSEPLIRQRADPEKIKHFVNWLVESNTLVSGNYENYFVHGCKFLFRSISLSLLYRYIWSYYFTRGQWRQI